MPEMPSILYPYAEFVLYIYAWLNCNSHAFPDISPALFPDPWPFMYFCPDPMAQSMDESLVPFSEHFAGNKVCIPAFHSSLYPIHGGYLAFKKEPINFSLTRGWLVDIYCSRHVRHVFFVHNSKVDCHKPL